ncbi:hypothetical protein PSYMO_29918 [Pseudomonas amygdali pv. mori str. 301020]|uniref:Uncharacterized protein n=1 Tax=Pseudomonas amygdali pv. mori str. 301020 TaxID=629261 RepID=A0A656GHW4_PSEA0|nr:hypothetical protein PSYMO_29918 [Pseudomonas amygdali pv. mori str. 301020]
MQAQLIALDWGQPHFVLIDLANMARYWNSAH